MSLENYNASIDQMNAIPTDQILVPGIPVSVAVQEAEDLVMWSKPDQETLIKSGLDWKVVEDLPVLAGACRYAQSVWAKNNQSLEEATKEWKERSPGGFELRDELVHYGFHAFYHHPDLYAKIQVIDEGGSNADMIQDLSDLHVLLSANQPLLTAVGLETEMIERAAILSDELGELLAKANGDRANASKSKVMRDRAYTLLKRAVDDIRRHGQFAFWRNEERKKGYSSKYIKLKNSKSEKAKEKSTGTAA